jgi:hypothetical protein
MGVLCNTSLNFNGKGFINNTEDLFKYARERGLDGIVIGDKFHVRNSPAGVTPVGISVLKNYDPGRKAVLVRDFRIFECIERPVLAENIGLTDWSLFSRLEFDILVGSGSGHKEIFLGLNGDPYEREVFWKTLAEPLKVTLNKPERIVFSFLRDRETTEILDKIKLVRITVSSTGSFTADIEMSHFVFS